MSIVARKAAADAISNAHTVLASDPTIDQAASAAQAQATAALALAVLNLAERMPPTRKELTDALNGAGRG